MRPQDLDREKRCFRVLRDLTGRECILIGGYAVSAFGPSRFSVDIDLVIPSSELAGLQIVLQDHGYHRRDEEPGKRPFAVPFERWIRPGGVLPVSADILIGGVADRVSGVTRSFDELRARSSLRRVKGIDSESWAQALVPDIEILLALKLQAGRAVDLRDVVVLSRGPFDLPSLIELLRPCPRTLLADHLNKILAALPRQEFRDSLKGVFVLDEREFRRYSASAETLCKDLLSRLER